MNELSDSMVLVNIVLLVALSLVGFWRIRLSFRQVRWELVILAAYLLFFLLTSLEIWWSVTQATHIVTWADLFIPP